MGDISVQFHAAPDELMLFIEEVIRDFGAKAVVMRFRPFDVKEVRLEDFRRLLNNAPDYRRWAFLLGNPVLSVTNELEFADKNPDQLRLDVGRKSEKGLEQSWLSARTANCDALATWKKVANRLKKRTEQGVTAVNPKTGATGRMKSYRYTIGAKSLEAQGTAMLPIAGTSFLKLEN
jgi:hypothetical protein